MTTEPTPTLDAPDDQYDPEPAEREKEIRQRPPFSVAFPGRTDMYLRVSTQDCVDMCKALNALGMIDLMVKLEDMHPHGLMLAYKRALQIDEGARAPNAEHIELSAIRDLVCDAFSLRTWGLPWQEAMGEVLKRNASFVGGRAAP